MKLINILGYTIGSFEYETDDGPVDVYYTFEPGDPDVGLADDYDIYIFDGEDDITFDADHNLYLKVKKMAPEHHRKMISDLNEP